MTRARDMNLIKARREGLGLLLVELAARIGRSNAFISMCEGGFVPAHARRVQIAVALDTTPEALWPEEYGA